MSSFKLLIASSLLALAAGCGFEPIAAPLRSDGNLVQADLAVSDFNVTVSGYDQSDRFKYLLSKEFRRFVDIGESGAPTISLDVTLSKSGLAITQDDTITRLNFRASTEYKLVPPGAAKAPTYAGTLRSITAVNATTSQFSTSVASKDAYERLAVDTARKILTVLRLYYAGRLPTPKPDGDG